MTCSKCGKTSPVGGAHNKRTCGQKNQPTAHIKTPHSYKQQTETKKTLNDAYGKISTVTRKKKKNVSTLNRPLSHFAELVGTTLDNEVEIIDVVEFVAYKKSTHEGFHLSEYFTPDGKQVTFTPRKNSDKPIIIVSKEYLNGAGVVFTLDNEGFTQSYNGNPAVVESPWAGNEQREWHEKGFTHNLHGPALVSGNVRMWFVHGKSSTNKEACEKATSTTTQPENFYELCSHEDPVVRKLATANPHCPEDYKVVANLYDDNS